MTFKTENNLHLKNNWNSFENCGDFWVFGENRLVMFDTWLWLDKVTTTDKSIASESEEEKFLRKFKNLDWDSSDLDKDDELKYTNKITDSQTAATKAWINITTPAIQAEYKKIEDLLTKEWTKLAHIKQIFPIVDLLEAALANAHPDQKLISEWKYADAISNDQWVINDTSLGILNTHINISWYKLTPQIITDGFWKLEWDNIKQFNNFINNLKEFWTDSNTMKEITGETNLTSDNIKNVAISLETAAQTKIDKENLKELDKQINEMWLLWQLISAFMWKEAFKALISWNWTIAKLIKWMAWIKFTKNVDNAEKAAQGYETGADEGQKAALTETINNLTNESEKTLFKDKDVNIVIEEIKKYSWWLKTDPPLDAIKAASKGESEKHWSFTINCKNWGAAAFIKSKLSPIMSDIEWELTSDIVDSLKWGQWIEQGKIDKIIDQVSWNSVRIATLDWNKIKFLFIKKDDLKQMIGDATKQTETKLTPKP